LRLKKETRGLAQHAGQGNQRQAVRAVGSLLFDAFQDGDAQRLRSWRCGAVIRCSMRR